MGSIRLIASALMLVVAGSALTGCSGRPVPKVPVGAGGALPPTSILIQDRTVPYQGLQAFSSSSVPSLAARTLTVFATGSPDQGGGPCGPPAIRVLTQETATTVRVLVADYEQPPGLTTACADIGYGPTPHAVTLRAALGHRALIDASTGKRAQPLDGSALPNLPHPPEHFGTSTLEQLMHEPIVRRTWTYRMGEDWPQIALLTGSASGLTRTAAPDGQIVHQFPLAGSRATVYEDRTNGYPEFEVQWTPSPSRTIRLQLTGRPEPAWTLQDAVRLSRSVTGYRFSGGAEQPLPPIVTPGTVAATYSSTEGPVTHVPNLLKSSGVWVGLSCQGVGHVAVTLRGRSTTWTCAAGQTRHVMESIGPADETFYLTVRGSADVRWTLTLARASLDGS